MLDASVAFQWPDAMYNHAWVDEPPPAMAEFGTNQRPWRVSTATTAMLPPWVPQPAEFAGMCAVLGRPDIPQDPRFATLPARYRNGAALRALLEPLMTQFDSATLEERFRAHGAALGRVNERHEALSDPQVLHNQSVVVVDNGDAGQVRVTRNAALFDGQAQAPSRGGARLGQHSAEVLRELGFSDEQISTLAAQCVLRVPPAAAHGN